MTSRAAPAGPMPPRVRVSPWARLRARVRGAAIALAFLAAVIAFGATIVLGLFLTARLVVALLAPQPGLQSLATAPWIGLGLVVSLAANRLASRVMVALKAGMIRRAEGVRPWAAPPGVRSGLWDDELDGVLMFIETRPSP